MLVAIDQMPPLFIMYRSMIGICRLCVISRPFAYGRDVGSVWNMVTWCYWVIPFEYRFRVPCGLMPWAFARDMLGPVCFSYVFGKYHTPILIILSYIVAFLCFFLFFYKNFAGFTLFKYVIFFSLLLIVSRWCRGNVSDHWVNVMGGHGSSLHASFFFSFLIPCVWFIFSFIYSCPFCVFKFYYYYFSINAHHCHSLCAGRLRCWPAFLK